MIRSSEHTKDWKIKLAYLDSDNPTNPKTMNHMLVEVDTGNQHYTIEATTKSNGLHIGMEQTFLNGDMMSRIGSCKSVS